MVGVMFFFQAEDGIRDLVRSRGLGDVYKRQASGFAIGNVGYAGTGNDFTNLFDDFWQYAPTVGTVSYTHLTLPTSDLV